MKQDRTLIIKELAENIELILQDKKENVVAFTTDAKKYNLLPFINEIANTLQNKKVAIATYQPVNIVGDIDNILLSTDENEIESIKLKFEEYDIVLVECPNVVKKSNYLSLSKFVNLIVLVVKEFDSNDADVVKIKELLLEQKMDVLGIVYQV